MFIIDIVNILLAIAVTVAILFLVIGGFQFLLAGANSELAKRGRQTLTNAIIGLVIIILSYVIVSVVANLAIGRLSTETPLNSGNCTGPFIRICR